MFDTNTLLENIQKFGVGRRCLEDEFFGRDKLPARLGIYDDDDDDEAEALCHQVAASSCPMAGCGFAAAGVRELERHYNAAHRYCCSRCRRALPSPHLLDLHVQETHDSFFAAMAARKPSYCCYIEECTDKFVNAEERLDHCVKVHKLPKDFRFEMKPKGTSKSKKKSESQNVPPSMDVDVTPSGPGGGGGDGRDSHKYFFHNSKQKGLVRYSGKTFTSNKGKKSSHEPNMDEIMSDLKQNLPN